MERKFGVFCVFLLSLAFAFCEQPKWQKFDQEIKWYNEQRLDHFDLTDNRTWKQRYFEIKDQFNSPDGPVFLHLCGEYTCKGVREDRSFPMELAAEHGALVVSVEHRFFGDSMPLPDWSVENLKYHNSRQGLADFAQFVEFYQTEINTTYKKTTMNKFFVIGGSYPGAMSAWMRLKYPHLVMASHAASGVVHAIAAYHQFDTQIAVAAGTECANVLRKLTTDLETGYPAVKAKFGAQNLDEGDFFYFVADAAVEGVQYGSKEKLCKPMIEAFNQKKDLVDAFVTISKSLGADPKDYDSATQKLDNGGNGRSWWWQKCTEFGWFQVAPANDSLRSQKVNMDWHHLKCTTLFGETNVPDIYKTVDETNNYYGALTRQSNRVLFTNGHDDPWQTAVPSERNDPLQPSLYSNCDGCGHCADLYTPAESDPQSLKDVRERIKSFYRTWLNEPIDQYCPELHRQHDSMWMIILGCIWTLIVVVATAACTKKVNDKKGDSSAETALLLPSHDGTIEQVV
eukprot:TRINITY_DN19866_c0_g1_i1.p1 TRINITY_DN19866_c0_g1~~TRINITY_DN19866_c0_g1_i1.p1  ORF type:complete len:512 (+),score=176.99 TRINITY_DN19866_c0_g1_i1:54-1589(+)